MPRWLSAGPPRPADVEDASVPFVGLGGGKLAFLNSLGDVESPHVAGPGGYESPG